MWATRSAGRRRGRQRQRQQRCRSQQAVATKVGRSVNIHSFGIGRPKPKRRDKSLIQVWAERLYACKWGEQHSTWPLGLSEQNPQLCAVWAEGRARHTHTQTYTYTHKAHPGIRIGTYTWDCLHSGRWGLSERAAAVRKGWGRRGSGVRFGRDSHRHCIIWSGTNVSVARPRLVVGVQVEVQVQDEREGRGWVVTRSAGPGQKGGLRSINAVVPNGRPSEDWLCQRLQLDHSRRRARRETMQAMQCNVR